MMLPFVFRLIIATLLLFSGLMPVQLSAQFTGEKQPFETGKWIQLQVNQGGFFKVGYQDLLNYGFNPAQINPKTIRLFVSQGAGYPDLNGSVRCIV